MKTTNQFGFDIIYNAVRQVDLPNINDYDINWKELYTCLTSHKIFLNFYKQYSQFIPEEFDSLYKEMFLLINNKFNVLIKELEIIVKQAEKNSIPIILLKGISYSKLIYEDNYSRSFFDIDLLTKDDQDAKRLYELLVSLGYCAGYGLGSKEKDFEKVTGLHLKYLDGHEYFENYKYIDGIYSVVEIGRYIHTLPRYSRMDYFDNTQKIDIDGFSINTFNLEYTFIAMVENIHDDSETIYGAYYNELKLRDYFDLFWFLKKYIPKIDWFTVLSYSNKYSFGSKIIKVISNLIELFDIEDPLIIKVHDFFYNDNQETGLLKSLSPDIKSLFINKKEVYQKMINMFKKNLSDTFDNCFRNAIYVMPTQQMLDSFIVQELIINFEVGIQGEYAIFNISSNNEIPDKYIISINYLDLNVNTTDIIYGFYLKKIKNEFNLCAFQSDSFLSTGNIRKYVHSMNRNDFDSQTRIECLEAKKITIKINKDVLPFKNSLTFKFIPYQISVHELIIGDIYFHLKGDDKDMLSKPMLLISD